MTLAVRGFMPKFKNRKEYEAWKAEKLQGSKEKLTTEPQEQI
jgi:hypothetical protein